MAISDIVGTSVAQFIDYALAIVSVMILYYIIKFFMVGGPGKEEQEKALEGRRKAFGDWRERSKEESKKKAETQLSEKEAKKILRERKELLEPAKGFAIRAEEAAERMRDESLQDKTTSAVREAESQGDKIKSNLTNLRRILRAARHQEKGEKREYLDGLYNYNEAIIAHFNSHIKDHVPSSTLADAVWKTKTAALKDNANYIRGYLGMLITNLDKFIEEGEMHKPILSSSPRAGGST